jgi:histidine triad (HIT) family protein
MTKEKVEDECLFCKIAKEEISLGKVYEDDNFISILDINPETQGHTLVIPRKHFKTILDIPNSLGNEFLEAIKNTSLKLINEYKAEGFNLVFNNYKIAGQEVDHVHAHIMLRKQGDGMKLKMINGLRDKKKEDKEQ